MDIAQLRSNQVLNSLKLEFKSQKQSHDEEQGHQARELKKYDQEQERKLKKLRNESQTELGKLKEKVKQLGEESRQQKRKTKELEGEVKDYKQKVERLENEKKQLGNTESKDELLSTTRGQKWKVLASQMDSTTSVNLPQPQDRGRNVPG
ncbi:hypothetical protein BDR04DRAFT_850074 [Suillus decipiens]|nr:hypothetical protein BDR04DRAFT_850074 [Suillus decipiens]